MTVSRTIRTLGLILLAGCAVSPKEAALNWLGSGGRTIAVRLNEELPRPEYQVHESRAGEGAREGAGKALSGPWLGGSADPFGLALLVVLIPTFALGGAAIGAATAEPAVHHYPLDKVEGAAALFDATLEGTDFGELLARNIEKTSTTRSRHKLVLVSTDTETSAGVGNMMITINTYSLVGELEDDPTVRLLVAGDLPPRLVPLASLDG